MMAVKFEISSGELRVTDPCYDMETSARCVTSYAAQNGTWTATTDEMDSSERIARLDVQATRGHAPWKSLIVKRKICVDSGQAGVFDAEEFKEQDARDKERNVEFNGRDVVVGDGFYSICCAKTLGEHGYGSVMGFGAVSSSGWGDGEYDVTIYVNKDTGLATRVVIDFEDNVDEYGEDDYAEGYDEDTY